MANDGEDDGSANDGEDDGDRGVRTNACCHAGVRKCDCYRAEYCRAMGGGNDVSANDGGQGQESSFEAPLSAEEEARGPDGMASREPVPSLIIQVPAAAMQLAASSV